MIKVELNMEVLLAMLNFAAKDDVRYYINGISINTMEHGFVRYAATNGHVLGLYRDKNKTAETPDATSLVISHETLKPIKLQKYVTHGLLTIQDAVVVNV